MLSPRVALNLHQLMKLGLVRVRCGRCGGEVFDLDDNNFVRCVKECRDKVTGEYSLWTWQVPEWVDVDWYSA